MRTLITLSALLLASNLTLADTFQYERQIGNQDLDPHFDNVTEPVRDTMPGMSNIHVSLYDVYKGNPDTEVNTAPGIIRNQLNMLSCSSYDQMAAENPDLGV